MNRETGEQRMKRTRNSRRQRTLAAAACVFFGPAVGQAIAQNAGAPKPEIMLLVGQADSPVPVFDTTTLHAMAAVERALAPLSPI